MLKILADNRITDITSAKLINASMSMVLELTVSITNYCNGQSFKLKDIIARYESNGDEDLMSMLLNAYDLNYYGSIDADSNTVEYWNNNKCYLLKLAI